MKKQILLVLVLATTILLSNGSFAENATSKKDKPRKAEVVCLAGETIGKTLKGKEVDASKASFVDKIVEFKPAEKTKLLGNLVTDDTAKYYAGVKGDKVAWIRVVFDEKSDMTKLVAVLDKQFGKPKPTEEQTARVYVKGNTWAVYRDKELNFANRRQIVRVEMEFLFRRLASGACGDYETIERSLSILPPKDKEAMKDLFLGVFLSTNLPGDPKDYGIKQDIVYLSNEWLPKQFDLALKGEGAVKLYREKMKNTALAPVPKLEDDNYDWYARHERILKEAKAMNPEIVLIGDSITHHWAGLSSIGGEDVTPHFKAAFKGKRVLDLGFGWDRIQNMLWRVENGELVGLKPKTIIIMAGTNNMTGTKNARANNAEEIAEGVIYLVNNVQRFAPRGAKIVVMGILPRAGKNDPMRTTAKEANRYLKKFAEKKGLDFIDLSDKFVDESGERIKTLYRDSVHLTPSGYAIWAEALKPYL